jgi:hypothetical protein
MPIDARKYQRLKEILATGEGLSAESRAKAEAAVAEYDNNFMGAAASQVQIPMEMDQAKVQAVVKQLDPTQPVQPQVLAIQPATGHVAGDKAAADEWVRGDLDNPAGKVIVYDAPVAKVRERLMQNPQIFKSLGYEAPLSPDAVMSIQEGDSIHQAYNDYLWRETADAAVKGGKTPYRYSKAPWLKSGAGASVLDTLSTKLKTSGIPAMETATAFVLGHDNTAMFNAGTAAGNAGLMDQPKPGADDAKVQEDFDKVRAAFGQTGPRQAPLKPREATVPGGVPVGGKKMFWGMDPSNDEVVGSVSAAASEKGTKATEQFDMLKEEHPIAHGAGQVLGIAPSLPGLAVKGAGKAVGAVAKLGGEAAESAVRKGAEAVEAGVKQLAEWNPTTKLWDWVTGANPGLLKSVAGAGVASGLHQSATEAVRAGANYAGTGETGTTLKDSAVRSGIAAATGAATALPFSAAQSLAGGVNRWVQGGRRYEGIPGRLEQLGTEFKFGRGPVPSPVVKKAREEAAARAGVGGVKPIDPIAEEMAGPLTAAVKSNTQTKKIEVSGKQEEVHQSLEGKALIPVTNLATTAVDIIRKRVASIRGRTATSVGVPNAELPAKRILNSNIEGVSLRPVPGAIPIKVSEMPAMLNPVWQRRAVRASERPDKAFRRTSTDKITIRGPDAPGRAAEAGADIERAAGAGGLSKAPDGLARTARYPGSRHPQLEAKDLTVAGPGLAKGSRQPTAGERTGAELPKVTARNLGPEGSRWRRRGPKEQAAADAARKKREAATGGFAEQLKARGIKTIYVLPRRYNSRHHESAVQMLRKRRDESATDRDLVKLYNAVLKDRDTRTWQGAAGGWSAMQRENERIIGAAKDTARRVAPNNPKGAYGRVVATAKQREGQSKDLSAMEQMAARAGVTEQLKGARSLDILEDLENRISLGRVKRGDVRSPLSPSGWFDAITIKGVYPVSKGIAALPGGGKTGKLSLVGDDPESSPAARRRARDEKRKPAYEKATQQERGAGGLKKKRRKSAVKKKRRKS